ncbi:MAG: type VI secretion system-associated FHA domain protein TagH [Casimicrobiaceae bacterium]|nr:type VI secretion system-associated FHA domain protein TagH [Casimicrobiaceae bacterium]MDW8312592.1 type VI secretion system-associated FHA domain protein TagH [Burkholderiales bacterium]
MNSLTLTVVTIDAVAPSVPISATFGEQGGTIGRDENSTLQLADKHRRVSRLHGTIRFDGPVAILTNASMSLPIIVGDRQLDYGEAVRIEDGDYIEFGPFVVVAHYNSPSAQAARAAQSATTIPVNPFEAGGGVASAPPAASPTPAPPAAPILPAAPDLADDPFAIYLEGIGTPTPPSVPLAPSTAPFVEAPTPTPTAATPSVLSPPASHIGGVPLDPLAALGGALPEARPSPSWRDGLAEGDARSAENPFALPSAAVRNTADPLSLFAPPPSPAENALAGGAVAPPVESLFPPVAPPLADPVLEAFARPGERATPGLGDGSLDSLLRPNEPTDPLEVLQGQSAQTPLAPVADHLPEFRAAFEPPRAVEASADLSMARRSETGLPDLGLPAPAASASSPLIFEGRAAPPAEPWAISSSKPAVSGAGLAPPPPASTAEALPNGVAVLTQAFLEGAELPASALPNGLTAEQMRLIGAVLRAALAGAIDLLAARATTKRELQASVTIISVEANNPLKFLPNADAALTQLLGRKMPGFMRADVAMRDAFEDLRAHEVGVIAGTRAALAEVLNKFDPECLERRLSKGSVLEALLPAARKARLWEQYVKLFSQVRREAEDDFHNVFGRAFVEAYERESRRIKGGTP